MKSLQVVFLLVGLVFSVQILAQEKNVVEHESALMQALRELHQETAINKGYSAHEQPLTQWIEQKVDNFNEADTRTWQMRYLVNERYFKAGGAMFIYVGGEWNIFERREHIISGHFVDMAKEHNGMLYYTEHRYYGESQPTAGDLSVENLKYLHVKQALADLAYFIYQQRANNIDLANSKVILVGRSYAATMVVWFKRLYPELVAGGWASSAPLLYKVDFPEYVELVAYSFLKLGGPQCYQRIEHGIAELERMVAEQRAAELEATFNLCSNIDTQNHRDVDIFFGSIFSSFASHAQRQTAGEIAAICVDLLSFPNDVQALGNFFSKQQVYCSDVSHANFLKQMKLTQYRDMNRPWLYQTCNEYANFRTSNSPRQPFGTKMSLLWNIEVCEDVFGISNATLYSNVAQTNLDFGGMQPNVTNIYMTHGELDPWRPLGYGVVLPGVAHCQDLDSISDLDSWQMRASKEHIAQLVHRWLKDN